MPTDLDEVITKLSDRNRQSRLRSAIRAATIRALKEEGIELSPEEWGELTARLIAAQDNPEKAQFFFDDLLRSVGTVLGPVIGALCDSRVKTNIVYGETLPNGLRLCEFSYRGFPNRWKGVIAQDVLQSHPEAVFENEDGHLLVDYTSLGVLIEPA